jgi:NAD(P)-dependent dehydrogenase (short-subunit alcohol dehydrogenase family)
MATKISFEGRTIAVTVGTSHSTFWTLFPRCVVSLLTTRQGGASGMGLALTIALANLGASVHVADFAKQLPAELANLSSVNFSGGIDVADRPACKKFIAGIPGRLDGLVNCAGICPAEGKMASDELFARIMAVNSTGTWNMGTEAIIRMSTQETRASPGLVPGSQRSLPAGSIVNIGSGASLRGIGALAAYCASKHAVAGMTRAWAKDWPTLRINAVAPG